MATRICRAVISVPSKANYPSLRVTFSPLLNALATREFSEDARQKSGGFWGSFMGSGDSRSGAHSKILSSKDTLYEFQFHHLKPDRMKDYIELVSSDLPRISDDSEFPAKLLGSWTTLFGPLDSVVPEVGSTDIKIYTLSVKDPSRLVHLWVYKAGYEDVSKAKHYLHTNEKFLEFAKERSVMLHKRHNQLLHAFSFWGEPKLRDDKNIYELRTYYLKPGTLIEWGNNWMTAIKYRQKHNEDVGGFFTQIGELYVVHHLWAYKNLSVRKQTREAAWDSPHWADCVGNTVPLIRKMDSRILLPLSFSPLT